MLNPSVEVKQHDGVLLAEFWDCLRLDPNPVRALRESYERHVQSGGSPALVVDLTGVGFAGSAALSGFVALRKLGARVVFHGVEPTVREVFRVSNLESLFHFAADQTEALAAAAAQGTADADRLRGGTVRSAQGGAQPAQASAPPLRMRKRADAPSDAQP